MPVTVLGIWEAKMKRYSLFSIHLQQSGEADIKLPCNVRVKITEVIEAGMESTQ